VPSGPESLTAQLGVLPWFALGALGLVFGSFLNVVIYRVPRGQSIVSPPSHCPKCKKRIAPFDNIPVLSYFLLGGRCRNCRAKISPRYLLVEVVTALLFLAAYARFGFSWECARALVFTFLLIPMVMIDIELQIIPFSLSVPGVILGLGSGYLPGIDLKSAAVGAALGASFVFVSWALWRYVLAGLFKKMGVNQKEGMGMGDLPLAAMIGGFLGVRATIVALFLAVVAGVIGGLILRRAKRQGRGVPMPFGPFLGLGGLIGLYWGNQLFALYLRLVLGS